MPYFNAESKDLIIALLIVATFFFCFTLQKMMGRIPKENLSISNGYVWLFLIPIVGLIFKWIMLPFAIPKALKKTFPNNQDAINITNTLFKLGLVQVIFTSLALIFPMRPYSLIATTISLLVWIVYWILIVLFKNKYLKTRITATT